MGVARCLLVVAAMAPLACAACRREQAPSTPAAGHAENAAPAAVAGAPTVPEAPAVPESLADDQMSEMARELPTWHADVTLAEWLRHRPSDSVSAPRPFLDPSDTLGTGRCVAAYRTMTLGDSTQLTRVAHFFPPRPPTSLALPDSAAREQCQLGLVLMEMPLTWGTPQGVVARIRRVIEEAKLDDSLAAESWYGRPPGVSYAVREATGLLARLPTSLTRLPQPPSARDVASDSGARVLAQEAARLSDLGEAAAAPLLAVWDTAYAMRVLPCALACQASRQRAAASQALRALTAWLAAGARLDGPRRAAVLLAADLLLGSAAMENVPLDADHRRALVALGAEISTGFTEDDFRYGHNWLKQAVHLDSLGRAGRLAALVELRKGFDLDGMCGGGEEAYRSVSRVAEALIPTTTDTAMVVELHLLAARGYADIVALARGAESHLGEAGEGREIDSTRFTQEAPSALRHAVPHYRQAFALAPASAMARAAWPEAWRLVAGLPLTTHFFCMVLE